MGNGEFRAGISLWVRDHKKGLSRYDESLIRDLVPFKPGDPYKRDELLAFQTKLQKMPQFSSAVVHMETDPAAYQAAPVEVVLSEAQTQRISLGAGYSSNTVHGARSITPTTTF